MKFAFHDSPGPSKGLKYFLLEEVAEELGVSEARVLDAAREAGLEVEEVGELFLIEGADVSELKSLVKERVQ